MTHEDHRQNNGEHPQNEGVAKALDGGGVDTTTHPERLLGLCQEHGHPQQLVTTAPFPQSELMLFKDLREPGEVYERLGLVADRLARTQITAVVVDPQGIAIKLGQTTHVYAHHHQAHCLLARAGADGADQSEGHELARILGSGQGIDADATDHHAPWLHAQAGIQKLLVTALGYRRRGMPGEGVLVPLQPEALLPVRTDEQDLDNVPLIAEYLIDPARIAGAGEIDLVVVATLS